MKKIGLWMAALTAVTVGGVYATFNYSNNFKFSKTGEKAIGLEAAAPAGAVGEYAVDVTHLTLTIDSAESLNKTGVDVHKAYLVIEGYITITFKPSINAEADVSNYGIETTFSFSPSSDLDTWTYTATDANGEAIAGTRIFAEYKPYTTTIMPSNNTTEDAKKWSVDPSTKVITYTINAADIADVLTLNDIILESSAEHAVFKQALLGKNLVLTVTAVDPNPASQG